MVARALDTPARNCATCDSCSRRSICPSTWPWATRSPSLTASESRSPEMFELTLTVWCACRCPAAVTRRVMGPRLATEVVISTGVGGRGLSPSTFAANTPATTIPAMIQRPVVIDLPLTAGRPAQRRLRFVSVHQLVGARQLRLRQLQLRVAHLELRPHAH